MHAPRSEFQNVLDHLKLLLRKRKLTYRDLARRMDLSESALKRFFTGRDGSMGRIFEICSILEVDFADLLNQARELQYTEIQFTPEQQEFLTQSKDHLTVFWRLVAYEESVEEVQQQTGLTDQALTRILSRLDKLQLIQWLPGNEIRVPRTQAMLWVGQGPLIDLVTHEWSIEIVKRAAQNLKTNPKYYLKVRTVGMLPETFEEYKDQLSATIKEFEKRASRDCSLYPDQVKDICMTVAAIPESIM